MDKINKNFLPISIVSMAILGFYVGRRAILKYHNDPVSIEEYVSNVYLFSVMTGISGACLGAMISPFGFPLAVAYFLVNLLKSRFAKKN